MHKDDMMYMEAYEKLLEAWMSFMSDSQNFPKGAFRQQAIDIFNGYLQCHLGAPDGTRSAVSKTDIFNLCVCISFAQ